MPSLYGEWRMPDGEWAVVRQLDSGDLEDLGPAAAQWIGEA